MELIDKAEVVEEIEKHKKYWQYGSSIEAKYKKEECDDILSLINTLKVKKVDVNKEIDNYLLTYWNEEREKFLHPFLKKMCVHFFELGITASNKI